MDGCVGEDDVQDDVGDANQNDIEGDNTTKTCKNFEVGGKKKDLITLEKLQKRLDAMQVQQNALQDQMTSYHSVQACSVVDVSHMHYGMNLGTLFLHRL